MKILKIELQNINSLKCDTPVVIDFESDVFKDVGLFAITGSTGAGKTTILDAITIALYRSVPRFNKTHSKPGLEDVVSYGASEALARVTFETKGIRYESQWSMRLLTNSGKRMNKPVEQVRLKNLSSGNILAESTTQVKLEIERITQLTYNQFLRSVMLAQGEFAAFLSADAKEKGNLLQQITGEEIYKRIGEALLIRNSAEQKVLETIKTKINSQDILSDERLNELKAEDSGLTGAIKTLTDEWKEMERVLNWFKKKEELLTKQNQLNLEKADLELQLDVNQNSLYLLKINEEAEPFKERVVEIARIEKDILKKKVRSLEITNELIEIKKNLDEVTRSYEASKKTYLEKEIERNQWQPRLEQVTRLDTELANTRKSTADIQKTVNELVITTKPLIENNLKNEIEYIRNKTKSEGISIFLKDNQSVLDKEKRVGQWNSSLTLRKSNRERMTELRGLIKLCEKEQIETQKNLGSATRLFGQENARLEELNISLKEVSDLLALNRLDESLARHQALESRKTLLRELQLLSGNHKELVRIQIELIKEKSELNKLMNEFSENIAKLQADLLSAVASLKDAETIFELESKIVSFEAERRKLEKGKPCSLCGALEHPYVEKYATLEISESRLSVEKRKAILENLTKEEKACAIKFSEIKARLGANNSQLKTNQQQVDATVKAFDEFNTEFKIDDQPFLQSKFNLLHEELAILSTKIEQAQQLQKQKNEKESLLTAEREKAAALKNEITRLQGRNESIDAALLQKGGELKTTLNATEAIEVPLAEEFSAFQLLLPETEKTMEFIRQLEENIATFHAKNKELVDAQNTLTQIRSSIQHNDLQIKEKNAAKAKHQEDIIKLEEKFKILSTERQLLLPPGITTEAKRDELQSLVEKAKKTLDEMTANLNRMVTDRATRIKENENVEKELLENQENLKAQLLAFEDQRLLSTFGSLQEITQALLSAEDKSLYFAVRKMLDDTRLRLKTLETNLKDDLGKQETDKNFEYSHEQALMKSAEIDTNRQMSLKRVGEIKQLFVSHHEIENRNKDIVEEIKAQERILKTWSDLMILLGGSKDAFNTYVQRLTLSNLINLANIHLYKLNKRYSLRMIPTYAKGEELNFMLVDHYQTDESRLVDTSSGGEKFLISLALALGLSDLASNNVNIGSLFIDEGFGSLDTNTLETVISTLETLQSQGKMIGIISHVDNLKERIPVQIQVLKKSNGVSLVEIV